MNRSRESSSDAHVPLQRYRQDIFRCVRCGTCRTDCPSFLAEREESFSARGRMALIEAALRGSLSFSEVFRDRLATCTGCLACETSCPSGVPVTAIIQAAKEETVRESGSGIIERLIAVSLESETLMRTLAWLAPVVLHYSKQSVSGKGQGTEGETGRRTIRDAGIGIKDRPRGRVAFFPGCAVSYFQTDIERASVNVLNALGYDVIVPHGLACCGRPFLSLGDRRAAEECAVRNAALFSSTGVDAVVTACASCGLTFKKEYPTLLAPSGRTAAPVYDIHEFLDRKIGKQLRSAEPLTVTWHDPCHLGRGQGLAKTARNVLRDIPGIELREMENPDRCCGFGGVMRLTRSDLSNRIGAAKARDIISTRASAVVTGCPGCRMQIADSLRRTGSNARVLHTVQVIDMALNSRQDGKHAAAERAEVVQSRTR